MLSGSMLCGVTDVRPPSRIGFNELQSGVMVGGQRRYICMHARMCHIHVSAQPYSRQLASWEGWQKDSKSGQLSSAMA